MKNLLIKGLHAEYLDSKLAQKHQIKKCTYMKFKKMVLMNLVARQE